MEKGFVPKMTDEEKLASLEDQTESIRKILRMIRKEENEIFIRRGEVPHNWTRFTVK